MGAWYKGSKIHDRGVDMLSPNGRTKCIKSHLQYMHPCDTICET